MMAPKNLINTGLQLCSPTLQNGSALLMLASVALSGCVHAEYLAVNDDRYSQFCSQNADTGATVCYDDYRRCEKARVESGANAPCVSRGAVAYGAMKPEN